MSEQLACSVLRLLLLCADSAVLAACNGDWIAARLARAAGSPMVGVYYYPWHGGDFHGGRYLRQRLQPALGEYDDRRAETISPRLSKGTPSGTRSTAGGNRLRPSRPTWATILPPGP